MLKNTRFSLLLPMDDLSLVNEGSTKMRDTFLVALLVFQLTERGDKVPT